MTAVRDASRCGGARLPFAPLEELLRRRLVDERVGNQVVGASVRVQALALAVNARQVHRWRHQGVTWAQADELAVRAGYHPGDVWEEWWSIEEDG